MLQCPRWRGLCFECESRQWHRDRLFEVNDRCIGLREAFGVLLFMFNLFIELSDPQTQMLNCVDTGSDKWQPGKLAKEEGRPVFLIQVLHPETFRSIVHLICRSLLEVRFQDESSHCEL